MEKNVAEEKKKYKERENSLRDEIERTKLEIEKTLEEEMLDL